ncbi:hypothetical protein Cni_G23523 [Canna indica]|uniref:Uncharacterized protein n=1 Tax=Canna indica TaxID=4628 RepID=A0AAQ3KTC0_9LILI|nr:hypothetical protein Cni_G23523 [Canna indica]
MRSVSPVVEWTYVYVASSGHLHRRHHAAGPQGGDARSFGLSIRHEPFGLVYTVYAPAIDPRKGGLGTIAPVAIGLIHRGRQHFGRWRLRRRVNEPGRVVRAGAGGGVAGLLYEYIFTTEIHGLLNARD